MFFTHSPCLLTMVSGHNETTTHHAVSAEAGAFVPRADPSVAFVMITVTMVHRGESCECHYLLDSQTVEAVAGGGR